MNAPKLMLERETYEINKDKYVFISYSHANSDLVYDVLNRLYSCGINYWFDKALKVGERWNDAAKKALRDENCMGVIFFISRTFLASPSCHEEIECVADIVKNRSDFAYWPVYIDSGERYNNLISETKTTFPHMEEPLSFLFDEKVIYMKLSEDNIQEASEKIYFEIKNKQPSVIDNQELGLLRLLDKRKAVKVDGEYRFDFGTYPQNNSITMRKLPTDDDVFDFDDNRFRGEKKSGMFFAYTKVTWRIISIDENVIKAIPVNILEMCRGSEDLILKKMVDIKNSAFTEKEKLILLDCKELDVREILEEKSLLKEIKFTPTVFVKKKDELGASTFWAMKDGEQSLRSLNGAKISINNHPTNTIAGLIPVITLDYRKYIGE